MQGNIHYILCLQQQRQQGHCPPGQDPRYTNLSYFFFSCTGLLRLSVSLPGMVSSMNKDAIPVRHGHPEIMRTVGEAAGAKVVGTCTEPFPKSRNNAHRFPWHSVGALEAHAHPDHRRNGNYCTGQTLQPLVSDEELTRFHYAKAFDPRAASKAVKAPRPVDRDDSF